MDEELAVVALDDVYGVTVMLNSKFFPFFHIFCRYAKQTNVQ